MKMRPQTLLLIAALVTLGALGCNAPVGEEDSTLTDAPQSADSSAAEATLTTCREARLYQFTLPQDVVLTCSSRVVFSAQVPDTGLALARLNANVLNTDTSRIFSWNARVTVGKTQIAPTLADNVCPLKTVSKVNLGYGQLTTGYHSVQVTAGDIYACSNVYGVARTKFLAGSTIDVWVEDPNCPRSRILADRYLNRGTGWVWPTTMTKMFGIQVQKPAGFSSGRMKVMSAVEGSTLVSPPNPNRYCGQESATLVTRVSASGLGSLETVTTPIPASQGQGHLVFGNYVNVPLSSLGSSFSVDLVLGSNTSATTIFTGSYGGLSAGDAVLGVVLQPQP